MENNTTGNKVVIENGQVKTILSEGTISRRYMPLEEARRLSHERINKQWELIQSKGERLQC